MDGSAEKNTIVRKNIKSKLTFAKAHVNKDLYFRKRMLWSAIALNLMVKRPFIVQSAKNTMLDIANIII